ncbi:hypothetical protein N9403_06610 [Gammaproteobacteria bacterium]|jgi:membrane protein implicated in regulation of membrane protease activity|nr:hypothetical protein [Gammaproteobacteria bacterium]
MAVDIILGSGNAWLIIGLLLCILELSAGNLIFFLPMGVSALVIGLILKLQESGYILTLISDWVFSATYWAILALILSIVLNKVIQAKETDDVNRY